VAAPGLPAADGAEPRPPLGVAFDGDLATRPDAVLAVALLNGKSAQGEARRISLSVSGPSLAAARLADVLAEFYPTLPLGAGYLTIGMADGPTRHGDSPALAQALAAKTPEGTPLFESRVERLVDTADNATLIRNMLLAQHDGNAVVVLAGAATGLARLLGMHGAREQIAAKVQRLVVALGAFPSGPADAAIAADVASARRLFAEWPTPIVAVGAEVGDAVRYPGAKLEEGLAWSSAHPVVAACRALGATTRDAPTAALAAMLHAVQPDASDLRLSEAGSIAVLDDGRTRFVPNAAGRHRYLIVDLAQRSRLLASYMSLVNAQPAPRPVRRPPPMAAAAPAASAPPGAPAVPAVPSGPAGGKP
jgi:hypothetical protein